MDFKTLLANRRAIREFQDRDVPISVVKEIIQDTCLAPTASNGQPCRFIIIQNRKFIKRLSDDSKKNLLADLAGNPDSPLKQYESILRDDKFNAFYNAPCLVYVTGPKKHPFLDVDCSMTVSYFMFSATSRGLGTCWIGLGANIRDRQLLLEMGNIQPGSARNLNLYRHYYCSSVLSKISLSDGNIKTSDRSRRFKASIKTCIFSLDVAFLLMITKS